jgi:hypothetical protein
MNPIDIAISIALCIVATAVLVVVAGIREIRKGEIE